MSERWTLTILFFLPLCLALTLLNEGLFHYDAIVLAEAVEKSYETRHLQPAINGRYGAVLLTGIIYFPFWLLGNNADFALRLTSALFYAASISAAYALVNALFADKRLAVYAALLFAVHPIYLSPNTFGKEHGMALFFVLLSFNLLIYSLKTNKLWILSSSVITLLFSHTIREATLFFVPFYSYLLTRKSNLTAQQRFLYAAIPYLLLFSLLYFTYFDGVINKTLYPEQAGTAYPLPKTELLVKAQEALLSSTPLLLLGFSTLGIFTGIKNKKTRQATSFFSILLLLSVLFFGTISTFAARYLDISILSVSILAGIGLTSLRFRILGHALFLVLLLTTILPFIPVLAERSDYNGQVRIGNWIAENTPENAVIIAQDDAPFLSYYGKRTIIGPPQGNYYVSKAFIEDIKKNISAGTPHYLVLSGLFDDPGDVNKNLYPHHFEFVGNHTLLSEDFHNAEIKSQKYYQIIWELGLKNDIDVIKRLR